MVNVDLQTVPSIHTEGYSTLISDSGITRYRYEAEVWDTFSINEEEPYWYFPEGIRVEQFDSLFQVEASLVADTAYHYEKNDLWHAIGNVVAQNADGRTFETSELFWDNKIPPDSLGVFYTNQLVIITEPDGEIIWGRKGFIANRSLTFYRIYSDKAEFLVEDKEDQEETAADAINLISIQPDSIQDP